MPDLIRYGKVCFESYTPFYTERTERLHSMLLNCGHELARSPEYRFDGLNRGNHNLVIWQYTLNGMGRVSHGGREYPVPPGSAFVLMVPEPHVYFLPPDSASWEFLYVTVNGSELVRLGTEYRRRNGIVRRLRRTPPPSAWRGSCWRSAGKNGLPDGMTPAPAPIRS